MALSDDQSNEEVAVEKAKIVHQEIPIKNENCEKYEPQCLFLEGACPTKLTEKCSELRNRCYLMKRMNVALEVLVRALKGELKEKNGQCEKKLKEDCVHLASMSKELLWRCLNVEGTCQSLKKAAKEKCASLEIKVEKEVEKVENDSCYALLEECHFYGPNCKEDEKIKNKCNELRTHCEDEHDIMYIPPEGPFIPIYPRVSIIEKVGLKELYEEMAKKGILIERIPFSVEDLILFLSQEKDGKFDQGKCEEAFKNCEYFRQLTRHSNYNCSKDKCDDFNRELTRRREFLKKFINDNYLFNKENKVSQSANIKSWHKLASEYISEQCSNLESECFYLEARRNNSEESKACQNVFAACYKRGVDAAAYERLENKMRGVLNIFNTQDHECEKKLVDVCQTLKNKNHDLLALCLHPKETCQLLNWDIQEKSSQLRNILEFTRDYPHKEDCIKFQSKCNVLKQDSSLLSEPCHTLKKNCRHLEELGEIQTILLNEKRNLKDVDNCTAELDKQCNHWSRKVHKQFSLSCALQSDSCERMTFNIYRYCENLKRNLNQSNIVNTLKDAKNKMDELRKLCPTWLPYCDTLLPNCAEEINQEYLNISLCKEIQKYCQPYQEREALENKMMYEFQGSLKNEDECMFKLKSYCTQGGQMNNNSLVSLCKDTSNSNRNNDTFGKGLCTILIDQVKKSCKILSTELEQEKKEFSNRIFAYNKLKKEVTKSTNIILTFIKPNNTTNQINSAPTMIVEYLNLIHLSLD
ncbi:hypothetical protein PCK1_000535 [Pneumocystis canis]|nr:hypothetical protein PCK1_000535 [Pneumocystis canis]